MVAVNATTNNKIGFMQLTKLAVICNGCFWLTIIFQVWTKARYIHKELLNTIVILGLISVVVNLVWLVVYFFAARGKQTAGNLGKREEPGITPKKVNSGEQLSKWFNLLSFFSQLIFLVSKFF